MPLTAHPTNSRNHLLEALKNYALRRGSIRAGVERFLTMLDSYKETLVALEEKNATIIPYDQLNSANSKSQELSNLSQTIRTAAAELEEFTTQLASLLPLATEDMLRRGNQVLFGSSIVGADSFLLTYDFSDTGNTNEYIVERINYGQDIQEIITDKARMGTIHQLLREQPLAAHISFF